MKLTIESTDRIVSVNGIDCRLWEGRTGQGVKVEVLIPRIAVKNGENHSQFEDELLEQHAPASADAVATFPLRMLI